MEQIETNGEDFGASDCPLVTETFAQYSFRMAREARLRKEAIAKEAAERKRQRKERSKEERRQERESRRQIRPELMALAGITKEQLLELAKAKAAEIEHRKEASLCVCCGDARGNSSADYCQECWSELKDGIITPPTVSSRQLESARCRVVRKGTEMS